MHLIIGHPAVLDGVPRHREVIECVRRYPTECAALPRRRAEIDERGYEESKDRNDDQNGGAVESNAPPQRSPRLTLRFEP
jgi:hypothetical protein